jgi:hypothetical protein
LTNRDFLGSDLDSSAVSILNGFLTKLPSGSRAIVSEPYMQLGSIQHVPKFRASGPMGFYKLEGHLLSGLGLPAAVIF